MSPLAAEGRRDHRRSGGRFGAQETRLPGPRALLLVQAAPTFCEGSTGGGGRPNRAQWSGRIRARKRSPWSGAGRVFPALSVGPSRPRGLEAGRLQVRLTGRGLDVSHAAERAEARVVQTLVMLRQRRAGAQHRQRPVRRAPRSRRRSRPTPRPHPEPASVAHAAPRERSASASTRATSSRRRSRGRSKIDSRDHP